MTNIILGDLLEEIVIDGVLYKINTDFKTVMRFEILMADNDLSDEEKLEIALEMFYGKTYIVNIFEAVNGIMYLYTGQNPIKNKDNKSIKNASPVYSFMLDADYIYASFISAYGIDLVDTKMHWWKFKSLFYNLPDGTVMKKIMGYRAMKIDGDMTDKEKKFYRDMKNTYSLDGLKTQEEKELDFANALWG